MVSIQGIVRKIRENKAQKLRNKRETELKKLGVDISKARMDTQGNIVTEKGKVTIDNKANVKFTPFSTPTIKKTSSSSGSNQQVLMVSKSQTNRTPTFIITNQTAPLANRTEVARFKARLQKVQQRLKNRTIQPLRPIKTIKNIRNKILKDNEGTIIYDFNTGVASYSRGEGKQALSERLAKMQGKLETKEATARDNKYLKSLGRQSAIFGLSFATETLRGIKGIMNLPKNTIKAIPKLPKLAINLIKNKKNIIPISKLRFRSFREKQGYLLKTSPGAFLGKVGANIFLLKASGTGLKLVGKVNKSATSKISQYLPKFTKKSRVTFYGIQLQKEDKILSVIKFKYGKKIYGFAVGISKIGKGKLVLSSIVGKAYKLKPFSKKRDVKKVITFTSGELGKARLRKKTLSKFDLEIKKIIEGKVKYPYLLRKKIRLLDIKQNKIKRGIEIRKKQTLDYYISKKGIPKITLKKGIRIKNIVKEIIQTNIGKSRLTKGDRVKDILLSYKSKKPLKIKYFNPRTFLSKSQIFTKKDISTIIGLSKTNKKEVVEFFGNIRNIRRNNKLYKDIFTPNIRRTKVRMNKEIYTQQLLTKNKLIFKKNLVNIAGALSTGVVNGKNILNKLSPMARKVINNNIKSGLVLIPKINFKVGIPSVSAKSRITGLSSLETSTRGASSQILTQQKRKVTRHIDYFKPITNVISRTSTRTILKSKSVTKQQSKLIEVLKTPTAQREIQRLAPRQKERLRQYLKNYLKFYPNMRIPLIRVIPFKFIVKSSSKVSRAINYRNLKTGWIVYGLSKGAYRRLNKKPLSKQDALSRGAYTIDRTTAKRFKIVPITNVKKFGHLIKREKGYYTITKPKFREFRIKRGTKYFLQYELIEKRKYGIDTRGEVKGLSLWKYLTRLKKSGRY